MERDYHHRVEGIYTSRMTMMLLLCIHRTNMGPLNDEQSTTNETGRLADGLGASCPLGRYKVEAMVTVPWYKITKYGSLKTLANQQ
jgi:hypothetical protein